MNSRLGILIAVLAATLAASWWLGGEEGEGADEAARVVRATRRPPPATPSATAPSATNSTILPATTSAAAGIAAREAEPRFPVGGPDLFPGLSWRPPPPPAPPLARTPPPPPMAPPPPFKYLGRWTDERGETVFLGLGERVLIARAGQRLEQWRLDKVDADSLGFTYLPLDQQRQLRLTP